MKNLVFINNPKCASTAIALALGLHHSHRTTVQMKELYPDWKDRFSFAFVRNPLDRLISTYEMVKMPNSWHYTEANPDAEKGSTLEDYCRLLLKNEKLDHAGWLPQSHFVDQDSLSFVGRYENMETDWVKVTDKKLRTVNETTRLKPRVEYYTSFICEAVARLYRADYCQFGYQYPLPCR